MPKMKDVHLPEGATFGGGAPINCTVTMEKGAKFHGPVAAGAKFTYVHGVVTADTKLTILHLPTGDDPAVLSADAGEIRIGGEQTDSITLRHIGETVFFTEAKENVNILAGSTEAVAPLGVDEAPADFA